MTLDVAPRLVLCWTAVCDGGPTLNQPRDNVFFVGRLTRNSVLFITYQLNCSLTCLTFGDGLANIDQIIFQESSTQDANRVNL